MRFYKMKSYKTLLIVLLLTGVGTSSAQLAQAQQTPSLIAEANRTVPASRGSSAQSFQIVSAILRETRRILVVLPASYSQSATDRRYPVTVVVDGEYLIAPVAAVSDELSRNGQIPESVIVGIENIGGADWLSSNKKRVYDLTPPGLSVSGSSLNEGGERFLDFIEKELLPAVDRQFRTAAPRAFVGVSSGGILATYVAATRSTYRSVVSLDAPIHLGENWLAKKLTARSAAAPTPLRYASLEAKFGWPEEAWKTLVAGAPASWKLYKEKFQLEGHETLQMLGAYLGLRQVFSDYSRFSAPETPTTSILPYYAKVSAALGATVIPPQKLLQNVVEDLLIEGRGAAARDAYNTLASGYGAPADSAKLIAQIAEVERRPPPTETVEGLLATPFPTPEEARGFIGDWVGDVWMGPDERRTGKTTLRIRVVDGRVVGETIRRTPEGERVQGLQYLRITPQGMTWGNMNGMRPRGVNLFEGTLNGDTLAGTVRFGGIDFRRPDGSAPEPLHFSFKRLRK
jgi:predicted alpha/beta superfamily hydrolase